MIRLLVVLLLLSMATLPAWTQDQAAMEACQERPTKRCVLELAISATEGLPSVEPNRLGSFVGMALELGDIDLALRFAPRLSEGNGYFSKVVAALMFTNSLEDASSIVQKLGKSISDFAHEVVPILVQENRADELATYLSTQKEQVDPHELAVWKLSGELRAGRVAAALALLEAIPSVADRESLAYGAFFDLCHRDADKSALPMLPYLSPNDFYHLLSQAGLAERLQDVELARSLVGSVDLFGGEDRARLTTAIAVALAKSGEFDEAITLAGTLAADDQVDTIFRVATETRSVEVLAELVERFEASAPGERSEKLRDKLIYAYARAGRADALDFAAPEIGNVAKERWQVIYAEALAVRGQVHEALRVVSGFSNAELRAEGLRAVAFSMR